jgi:hypothetical protein
VHTCRSWRNSGPSETLLKILGKKMKKKIHVDTFVKFHSNDMRTAAVVRVRTWMEQHAGDAIARQVD